jgi:hypothetical protein
MTLIEKIKLGEGEKALHVIRHWIGLLVPHFVFCFLIALFDFFLMFYLFSQGFLGALAFIAILVIVIAYSGRLVFLWRRNILVITSKRLIDWAQMGFFEQMIQEIPFADIDGVEAGHKGLLGKIFKFGNLTFKMKGEKNPFVLYKVKFPVKAAEMVKRVLGSVSVEPIGLKATPPQIDSAQKNDWNVLLAGAQKLSLDEKKEFYREFKKILKAELEEAVDE